MSVAVLLAGRLYGEPVVKTTKNGNRVLFFKIKAVNGSQLEWWNCTAFEEEIIAEVESLGENFPIAVTGDLSVEEWERDGKSGINKKVLVVAILRGTSRAKRKSARA